ncbi:MAG: ABC transporter permease [Chloroflexi bacterium]|nr:ABC transporter permease [Chloroflexota bacterium]
MSIAVAGLRERISAQPGTDVARLWNRVRRNQLAFIGSSVVLLVVVVALLAPVLPLPDPNKVTLVERLKGVLTPGHLLGTDELGRDLASRLIWGARISLLAGFAATAIGATIGIAVGLLGGYLGGWTDQLLMRLTDMFMAFPTILLALAIVATLGTSLANAVVAIGFAGYPFYARTIRASVLAVRELDFVLAARALGVPGWLIMVRHIFLNTLTPIVVLASLDVGNKIILVAGLSFLGLGSQPPTADWGTMLSSGRNFVATAPHVATLPGLAIFAVVLSFNLIGDGLRDVFDPRSGD